MPVVFIHGVNTRRNSRYEDAVAAREALLRRLVLEPVFGSRAGKSMAVVDAYWGDAGVSFRWDLASVPTVSLLDSFGDAEDVEDGALDFAATVDLLTSGHADESLNDGSLRLAAASDPTLFLETALSPMLLDDVRLSDGDHIEEGRLEAALAIAANDVAADRSTKEAVEHAGSDSELMEILRDRVTARFEALMADATSATESEIDTPGPTLEEYGKLDAARDRIAEVFARAHAAPARITGVSALSVSRERLHRRLSCFMGDIFVYLNERGDAATPGPIVAKVVRAMRAAPRGSLDEPLVVITHSMGGNILYDLLTYYDRSLCVDCWVSVGGQVGQFEEMKLFRASDPVIRAPARVTGLRAQVGYWLNVYDPADPFGFMTAPVFGDVDADIAYSTGAGGLKAHSEYFGRASFYRLIRKHLEMALRDPHH